MDAAPRKSRFVSLAALEWAARLVSTWVFIVLGLASVGHFLSGGLDSAMAPRPWLGFAYGWWVALAFGLAQLGIGRRVRGLIGAKPPTTGNLEDNLFSFVVGFWLSCVAALVLAGAGLLNGAVVAFYLLVGLVAGLNRERLGWLEIRRCLFPSPERGSMTALGLLIAVGVVLWPYLLQTILPNSDWDGASTHLPLAQWFASQGLLPLSLDHSNLIIPGSVHLVYAMFLAVGAEQAIVPLNFLFSLLTCVAAASLARHFWGEAAGWWTLVVALSTNLILELGLDPRIDGFLAFFCTMAAFGIMKWILEGSEPDRLIMAGMALGSALGTKYTAVIPLALWGAPVCWRAWRDRGSPSQRPVRTVLLAFVCLVVPSGYWYISNTISYGDPLYPRLKGQLMRSADGHSVPWRAAVDELLEDAERGEEFQTLLVETKSRQSTYQTPRNLFNLSSVYLEPGRHSRKPGHTLSPLLLLFVLLPFTRRDRASRLLWWMGLSTYIVIGVQTYLVRYGMVSYPLLAAGAGGVLAGVTRLWWRLGWVAVMAALLVANFNSEWRQVGRQRVWPWISGRENRIEWLQKVGYNGSTEMPVMIRQILEGRADGSLPPVGQTLMLGEAKFHLLGFQYLPDISRTGDPWLAYLARNDGDLGEVHRELWSDDVRYLLVNLGYFGWVRGNTEIDVDEYAFSMTTLREFVENHGEIVISTSGVILLRLAVPV